MPPEPLHADYACVSCRTPFLNRFPLDDQGRCPLCRSGLRGFDAAYCYGSYDGLLREWIHLYKYARIKTLARPLGRLLAAAVPDEDKFDAIVPVPLHWLRRWHRGFNQSEILARGLGQQLGVPLVFALRRARSTQVQAGLSNTARRQNVAQAFRSRRGHSVAGKRILLVDDVNDHRLDGRRVCPCAQTSRSRPGRSGHGRASRPAPGRNATHDFAIFSGGPFRCRVNDCRDRCWC